MSDKPRGVTPDPVRQRRMEIYSFLIVTVILLPGLTVATVGAYGFSVWIYQVINGPPGPPKTASTP